MSAGVDSSYARKQGRATGAGHNAKKPGGAAANVTAKGGGALGAPPPSTSSSSLPSTSLPLTSRGATKPNTLGDQSRESSNESFTSNRKIQNGSNAQSHHGLPLTPGASVEVPIHVYEQPFAFQFGSISPGFVNGLQIPARTSSAPPILDEQNCHQARYDSTNAASLNGLPMVSCEPQPHHHNKRLETQVQGRRYLHGSGHPISLAPQHPSSGGASPVLFQQTQSPPIAVQMQYSAPSSQQLLGTPPRPPPSLPPPALRSQQVLMQQGQRLKVQPHILPPSLPGMPQHINPIGGQFSVQQLPQIVHHVGTQMGVPIGTKLRGGISGTRFGSPVMNHYIPTRTNRAVKITHPETHEELRFDSNSKKSESYMDNVTTTSLSGSVSLPGRTATSGSPLSRPSGVSHTTNFYPVQTGSYGHPSTFYQPPASTGPLNPPPQRCNSVHQLPEQILSTGMGAQPIVPKLGTSGASSTELSRPIVCDGAAVSVSLTMGHGITQTRLTAPSEKDVSSTSSSNQTQDTHFPSSATDMPQSVPLDSSEQLYNPDDSVSLEVQNVESLGSLASVANEASAQTCDEARSVVVLATDNIKHSMACSSISAQLVPVVDMVSSCVPVSAPKLGSKTSGPENPKGDSVKASGPTRENLKKKSKKKKKASTTSKYVDSKEAPVSSFELTRKINEKNIKLPQEPDSVSAVSLSSPVGDSLSADERSSTLHESGSSMNNVNSLNMGTSKLLTERISRSSGPVYDFVGDSSETINKPVEYVKPVDHVRSVNIDQVTGTFNKLDLSSSATSQANVESDTTVRDFEIQSSTEIPSGGNSSANNLDTGNKFLVIKNQAVHQYESQTKGIRNSESSSIDLSLRDVNHGQPNGIVSSLGICESKNLLENLPLAGEIKGEELSSAVELSTALDERHEKHLSSDASEFQELSFTALDEESTLLDVNRNENKDSTAIAERYQLEEVAHDMELPSESSGLGQLPSFATENKTEVLYGVAKKGNVNLRDKPMNVIHSAIEKNECTPSVTNHQSVVTASIGAGNKRAGSKKKKRKECLAKADASSSAGDLYNAYKAPEEKQKDVSYPDASTVAVPVFNDTLVKDSEKESQKELEDWEDVAELPTQNKVTEECAMISTDEKQMFVPKVKSLEGRKYTRDFLLTFKDQFRNLPVEFEVQADIVEVLLNPSGFANHLGEMQTVPNLGRALDRQLSGGVRPERLGNNLGAEDKWNRSGGYFLPGKDLRLEVSPGGPPGGFRPGQGMNPGLLRNVRGAQINPFTATPISGGPLTQMHVSPGGFPRNTFDTDRWQRAPASSQKGLFSSPRNNYPVIHKAENKYEVGKVSDKEHSKQRQIKAILNKLTPQNFDKLFVQVKEVNIDSAFTLTGVISQIFDKALMEPTFCEMYAKFCVDLAADLPEFNENNEKITFKRVLLNKCQEEFERGEREQAEADRLEEEGEVKLSKEEREVKRIKARRRMLGNIRFIGELYKMSMLTERIMHECIMKLLGEYQYPDEEDVEALCKLMSTIGHMIDRPKAREHIDAYFDRMTKLSNDQKLSSRLRFLLKDVIDLRKNGWQQRRKVEGPKKIEEVHRDAVQERQAQGGRSNRGTGMGSSGRRLHMPPDYVSRGSGSMVYSSGQPMSSSQQIRGAQLQMGIRGFGGQDVRLEGRLSSEKRSMQMHLTQRPDDVPVALVPQGSLPKGMTHRGHPVSLGRSTLADVPPVLPVDNRQINLGQMPGHTFHVDRHQFPARDEFPTRTVSVSKPPNSLAEPLLEKTVIPERNPMVNVGRDFRKLECSIPRSDVAANHGGQLEIFSPVQVPLIEKQLREKSDMTIREYYSVIDMDEAALCMDDLKAPWFHSDIVSQWVTDSFDRNDVDRDLLAKLLIYLCNVKPNLLSHEQLLTGLEITLSSLEDTVVDAPRAPEFLGVILGKLVVAEILSLAEFARIIKDGGLEPGHLLEIGLAFDVISSVLDFVRREKGEVAMTDMYRTSGLQLQDFMPCDKKHGEFQAFLEKKKLQCLYPLIRVENQISESLMQGQPVEQLLKWVETNVPPSLQSEPEFLKMLTIQVLRCCVPSCTLDYEKDLKGKLVHYASLLRHFAPSRHKQRHYITAIQLFANELDHPLGLMTALFNNFYVNEVILEDTYFSWQDDIEDTTPGKEQAIREVGKWLSWLTQAPEAQN